MADFERKPVVGYQRHFCPFGDESWCDVKVACMSVSVFKTMAMKPAVPPAVSYRDRRCRQRRRLKLPGQCTRHFGERSSGDTKTRLRASMRVEPRIEWYGQQM